MTASKRRPPKNGELGVGGAGVDGAEAGGCCSDDSQLWSARRRWRGGLSASYSALLCAIFVHDNGVAADA